MHRIDAPTADQTNPDKPVFTQGNPATGVPATVVTPEWLNDIQENLAHVIEAAGVDLTKGRQDDLKDALDAMIAGAMPAQTAPQVEVPAGLICMWSGAMDAIPTGWALCDGQNNTPDLRDRFVVGAGSSYSAGSKGGAATATTSSAGSHGHGGSASSHTLTTSQMPAHDHRHLVHAVYIGGRGGSPLTGGYDTGVGDNRNYYARTDATGGSRAHAHSLSISSAGSHSHTVDAKPPFYALAFIMKG